ncbi:hypothetical protein FRC07_005495 [Ceratobasidium sp. 392]|nr:hypothetical protein FRC07_005495 [Ceratobasidium sp. 392]
MADAAAPVAPEPKVFDREYYDLLGVRTDVNELDLKKAYRRAAIKYHPDKNPSPDAEEKFKEISTAYQILSDGNLRAVYDKQGKKKAEGASDGFEDASAFFANVFGGERFMDWIGEISLLKEMTSAAEVMMTDEDRAAVAAETGRSTSPNPQTVASASTTPPNVDAATTPLQPNVGNNVGPVPPNIAPDSAPKPVRTDSDVVKHDGSGAATPTTTGKEANKPGDKEDPEVKAWLAKIKTEAEDLKLESFGVELLHTIGAVYLMKANSALKSRKFLGIPGFVSRLKEKGAVAKEAWGVLGSAIGVQHTMEDMARLQEKGEAAEAELRALEMDLTGKILLASWRGTRWEVSQVLREVCDKVLEEPGVNKQELFLRAQALFLVGELLKEVKPDESDEERRELERLVADASRKKGAPPKATSPITTGGPVSEGGHKKGWKWKG